MITTDLASIIEQPVDRYFVNGLFNRTITIKFHQEVRREGAWVKKDCRVRILEAYRSE